jgi:predicted nucleotidyltransferase
MCYKLSAELILLNYFANRRDKKSISFQELNEISKEILEKCNYSIITDITLDQIERAIQKRHDVLQLNDICIKQINDDSLIWKNIDIVNMNVPEFVQKFIKEAC